MLTVPVHDGAGRRLTPFQCVQPFDHRVGIAAEHPAAEQTLFRHGQMAGARSHDHGQIAGADRSHPEHAEIGINTALRHGNPWPQSQLLRRHRRQL